MPAPQFTELNRLGNSRSNRWGSRVTNFLLHTQEGDGTAESLASYLNNPNNGASYHYTVRDGVVCDVVDTDYASWSVLDANSYTINLCFAGSRASWSREQWLAREHDIRIAAWLAVQDARKYSFAPVVIAPPYYQGEGISDHRYVTDELGIGTHTDVGPGFPWDRFAAFVSEYAGGATLVNEIDAKAEVSPWLGARLTAGENVCPDNIGRWAHFEHGYIYWSPSTGAHPIPDALWSKFEALGWEVGPLGYPTTDHTVLTGPDGQPWGDVQGFQGGALYRRYGQPIALWVHGAIRDHWNRSGFENGPFGWPTSDEQPFDGAAFQDFEHGRIYWMPKPTLGLLNAGETDKPLADAA
ncbi:N-acetylmuramoyl-L-alanine amidase [Nocardia xishanensis]|uniref:N-acetylmuramoyl-L-alanine amidase n=1 Tax=Nocardia xishanensis TaxID=238964 RepID=UPI0008370B86|nr:N-acetylmuramoyl-L-alanine amidase [Nocardia xishanensis]